MSDAMKQENGTVVFDLDGTLADTAADLIGAANACFEARGLGALLDTVKDAPVAFRGGRAMLRAGYARAPSDILITPAMEDEDYPRLLDHYEANIAVHTRLYPGVAEALDRLVADGFLVCVCTNKPEGLAEILLRELGIRDRFASLVGADTLPVRKPDPAPYKKAVIDAGGDPAHSLLVGDTETDVKTARNAGVPIMLVAFGPEGEGIRRLAPDVMLDRYSDLPKLAGELLHSVA